MNKRYSFSLKTLRGLVCPCLLVLGGCTNVAGDVARIIELPSASPSGSKALFSIASNFFVSAGYDCGAEVRPDQFRCSKNLRDLYIHQTKAVVEIYPANDEDDSYTLVTNRWDEGLIPGELVSGTFSNADVEAFCQFLLEEEIGECRTGSERAGVRFRFNTADWGYAA
ncbi:hypothetical protein J057_15170 [Marinobacter nanhaiticus D15-8W]|uniref:Lipoprotein n=2 Tax=Marinobacter TaxID=2742 RepID=N6VRE8_9GAMM|nr:hypothetical protein J057_15170 [Marinobacter nanhaiticus D15-8W]